MIDLLYHDPLIFFITAIMLVISLSVHEFFHAWTADRLGDPTPRLAGRLTLNPIAHLDPVGTILLFFAGFGWGRPVPFDPFNLHNPKKDAAVISVAGPASNMGMALVAGLLLQWMIATPLFVFPAIWAAILEQFIFFNVLLAVFNLIPIHPLDGFKVVAGLLPKKYYRDWLSLERYGLLFLLLLIIPFFGQSPVHGLIIPIVEFIVSFLIPGGNGTVI